MTATPASNSSVNLTVQLLYIHGSTPSSGMCSLNEAITSFHITGRPNQLSVVSSTCSRRSWSDTSATQYIRSTLSTSLDDIDDIHAYAEYVDRRGPRLQLHQLKTINIFETLCQWGVQRIFASSIFSRRSWPDTLTLGELMDQRHCLYLPPRHRLLC